MATRTITTRIALDGEQEFKRQMASVNSELRTSKSEMQLVEAQFKGQANTVEALTEKDRVLRREIEQQQEKVKALAQAVVDSAAAYGDADKRTDGYRQSLNKAQKELIEMNRELEDTVRYLEEAEDSADGTASSIDGFGKKVDDAGGGLDGFIGKLGDLKGFLLGGALTAGAMEVADKIFEIVDSTKEYRQVMGTLEVAAREAGYEAEVTQEIYGRLHSVIGDTQAAAEATTQLQALRLSEEDLNLVTDATIGMWVALGQAAPIESIAEAVQQTIAAGKATGAFSDYLMSAGISEDEFNAKLETANGTTERANMVLQMLSAQGIAGVGQAWLAANQDIVTYNESQEKMNAAMGRLGSLLTPIANGLRNLGANGIDWLVDKIEAVIPMLQGMAEVAEMAWNAITGGEKRNSVESNQYGSRSVDGSHASGLERVPWDGYTAELHKDEAVLNSVEADWWRSMRRGTPIALDSAKAESTVVSEPMGDERPIQITTQVLLDGNKVGESVTTYQKNKERARGK